MVDDSGAQSAMAGNSWPHCIQSKTAEERHECWWVAGLLLLYSVQDSTYISSDPSYLN